MLALAAIAVELLLCDLLFTQQGAPSGLSGSPQSVAGRRAACDGGRYDVCVELANAYLAGDGTTPRDYVVASSLYRRACDHGNPLGCIGLAERYAAGQGVPEDRVMSKSLRGRATEILESECGAGDSMTCLNLARLRASGRLSASASEVQCGLQAAARQQRDECGKGNGMACRMAATIYARGEGVERDEVEAVRMYRRACELDDVTACVYLALEYRSGEGIVPRDHEQAALLFEDACRLGRGDACVAAAALHAEPGKHQDLAMAAKAYRAGCEKGDVAGCFELARLLDSGEGVAADKAEARRLVQLACQKGLHEACEYQGKRQ